MLFNLAVFSGLLTAPIIRAAPFRLGSDIAQRQISNPSWAGALLHSADDAFNSITASVVAPGLTGDSGSGIIVTLGIDPVQGCKNGSFQIGFSATIENGRPIYTALYHDPFVGGWSSINLDILAGEAITLVVSTDPDMHSGRGTITNFNTGQNQSVPFNSHDSSSPICGEGAGWLIEDVSTNGASLVNFGEIVFTDAAANLTTGGAYYPNATGINILDIAENGKVMTRVTPNGTTLTIQHL